MYIYIYIYIFIYTHHTYWTNLVQECKIISLSKLAPTLIQVCRD